MQVHNLSVVADKLAPGDFRVERFGLDGECFVTIFTGCDSKKRAEEFAAWLSSAPMGQPAAS